MKKISTLFVLLSILLIASNFFIISCPDDDDDVEPTATPTFTPTPTATPNNSASIQCSFDPPEVIPVYEGDKWVWYFDRIIQETNGFNVTIQSWWMTFYNADGNQVDDPLDWSQYIIAAFGTNQLPAYGELSSNTYIFRADHTDTPSSLKYVFGGIDENNNTVSCECTVYFSSSSGSMDRAEYQTDSR